MREHDEFAGGCIDGAVNVPLDRVIEDTTLIEAASVVVVCERGARAATAADALRATGVEATVLDGGMAAWRAAAQRPASVS